PHRAALLERNPLRAGLVARAEEYPWSSLWALRGDTPAPAYWHAGPVTRPSPWAEWGNQPLTSAELADVRTRVVRGRPYGQSAWSPSTPARLGVDATPVPA